MRSINNTTFARGEERSVHVILISTSASVLSYSFQVRFGQTCCLMYFDSVDPITFWPWPQNWLQHHTLLFGWDYHL